MTDARATPVDRLWDALDSAGSRPKRSGAEWKALCPAHPDSTPSLDFREGRDGNVILTCRTGCDTDSVLAKLGLTRRDLFAKPIEKRNDWTPCGHGIAAEYLYRDEQGKVLFGVVRCPQKCFRQWQPDPTSKSGKKWSLAGVRRVLYRLPELIAAVKTGQTIYIVEGEKDVHRLVSLGHAATTSAGGGGEGKWLEQYAQHLAGSTVVIVADRDEAGIKHARAAAANLRSVGCKVSVVQSATLGEKTDVSDHLDAGHTLEQLVPLDDAQPEPADSDDDWATPEPAFGPPLPEFPTKRLPSVLAAMAEAASAEVQTPVGMAGMLSLAVAASTLAGKVEVVGRPGHVEQLVLWVFIAANSAERKTPVFNLLRAPLIAFEQEHERENALERKKKQFQLKVIEGQISALEKRAIKDGGTSVMAEMEAAHMALEDLHIPPRLELWVSSPTPEAIHNKLSEHDGRMAVFSDEGGLFGIIAGRYAGKSGGADIDPFLSGFVGSPLRAPRVTAERKNVPAAFLTMGFAVQPSVLADLGAVAGAEDRGLIGRFVFGLPTSKVGERAYGGSVPVPAEVRQAYAEAVVAWAAAPVPSTRHRLMLAPDAYAAYTEFHDRIEARLRAGGDLAGIGSWGGKIAGTTLRIAAICHAYDHFDALDRAISLETINNAIAMTDEFFIPHAFAAFRVMRHGADKSIANRLISWIAAKQLERFTLNQAFKQLSGGAGGVVKSAADVLPSLAFLAEGGYIRRAAEQPRADSVLFEVNPLWDFR